MIPIEKIESIVSRHDKIEKELSSGSIDPKTFAKKSKEYSDLGNVINIAREYLKFENDKKDLDIILNDKTSDKEMINLADKELLLLAQKKVDYENKLKVYLLPKDLDDQKDAIVEIRAGTGGLEASLFCSDLFKMYEKVCSKKKMENRYY